jgi:hypothetical protein
MTPWLIFKPVILAYFFAGGNTADGDGTSLSVWCSHVGWHPNTDIKSGHQTD